jgi:hypothetical protein
MEVIGFEGEASLRCEASCVKIGAVTLKNNDETESPSWTPG